MRQLVTRLGECLYITPINLISRFTFHKEESVNIMTVYLKDGEFFEANEVLVDTKVGTDEFRIAGYYVKGFTYKDYGKFTHEMSFKEVSEYIEFISLHVFG